MDEDIRDSVREIAPLVESVGHSLALEFPSLDEVRRLRTYAEVLRSYAATIDIYAGIQESRYMHPE